MKKHLLKLYVAGNGPNSALAQANIRAFCEQYLEGDYTLTIVDVLRDPAKALAEGVLVTPMLVRSAPEPELTVLGNLSQISVVTRAFGLDARG